MRLSLLPFPLPLASAIIAVVPRRRRDVDVSAVVDAQVLLAATETCAPAVGPHSAPAHHLRPFGCVMLPLFLP
jgi:hypothetical protein